MNRGDTPALKSPKKLFSILEYLIEADGAGVTEIASATSLAKSTVHLHLQFLLTNGHVIKEEDEYYPSLQLFEWGERIRSNIEAYRKGRAEIDSLAEKTNELVNLGVVENGIVRLVHSREITKSQTRSPTSSISTEFEADAPKVSVLSENYNHALGGRLHMHATGMGKAMLAEMSQENVESVIDRHGLAPYTENTITSQDKLLAELETVLSKGYAEDNEERLEGLCCVAAAICEGETPVAAVSISGLASQLNGEYKETLVRRVINTANVIEVKLTHS